MGESRLLLGLWQFIAVFIVLFHGYLLGKTLFVSVKRLAALPLGTVLFLALQSILQTAWYYIGGRLNWQSDLVTLALTSGLTLLVVWLISRNATTTPPKTPDTTRTRANLLLELPFALIALGAFIYITNGAINAATTESIRTPWPLLPPFALLAIAVLWLSLICSLIVVRRLSVLCLHAILAIGGTTVIAPVLYRIGFGFDGFLHIASERILLSTGTLSPKPLSYIGQYVFTTWISRLFDLPIASIDRWLVPVAAAILLPLCLYIILRARETDDSLQLPYSAILVFALLPLAPFVATTPQSFAYILTLAALILAVNHWQSALLISLWATAVHPLAGIPAILIVLAISIRHGIIPWVLVLLAAAAVPLLFFIISAHGPTAISWDLSTVLDSNIWLGRLASFAPWIGNHFVLWPAWATLIEKSLPVLLLALAVIGASLNRRRTPKDRSAHLIVAAILFWIAATVLKTIGDFAFLIDYERSNYADRLNMLAVFCLIPVAGIGIETLWQRAKQLPILLRGALILAAVLIATGLAYDALPRHDAMITGHGWSVSAQDIDAVTSIDRDAQGRAYTVLANQSVSAAAVRTLGFKRYTKNDVFFYPIPTGGPLYQTYLDVTYKQPSRDLVRDAATLGESDLVYVVLNKYWWNADVVAEQLKTIASATWDIDGGTVRVYQFDLKADSNAATATSTR